MVGLLRRKDILTLNSCATPEGVAFYGGTWNRIAESIVERYRIQSTESISVAFSSIAEC
jgi:hypothetical protein